MKASATTFKSSPPLDSRATVVFVGLSYFFVGLGFSYLDRRYGSFALESILWLAWTVMGFGTGLLHTGKPESKAAKAQWVVLGAVGMLLAIFPGFVIFNLLRWASIMLMIVVGARAAILQTRRDFYLTLTVVFVVSFMVATHDSADWTLWIYLGPAWVCGGLALAWDHAAHASLPRWLKLATTLGFISVTLFIASILFLFAPRPDILGFGFLPPGTETPGHFKQPAGGQADVQEKGESPANSGGPTRGEMGTSASSGSSWGQRWEAMFQSMRARINGDRFMPAWQRGLIEGMLGAAQSLLRALGATDAPSSEPSQGETQGDPTMPDLRSLLLWLLLLLVGILIWRKRYRMGLSLTLGCAWLLASQWPRLSMHISALSLKWCLHIKGHQRAPGQSVREHWVSATTLAPLARRWLRYAMEIYCAMRFGELRATSNHARQMQEAVRGACDIVMGYAPELNH